MPNKDAGTDRAQTIVRMADGTVKQKNLLSGTEVWTVPGRGHRPLAVSEQNPHPIDPSTRGCYCPFCEKRYLETPPEKARLVRHNDGTWEELQRVPADALDQTTAEFRRIPNLFEIISYNYWNKNHGHVPSEPEHRHMAEYLASSQGYEHVMNVIKARMMAGGMTEDDFFSLSDSDKLRQANGFFSGGHDVIVARRHYTDNATGSDQLAASGTLTPEEHYQYTAFTARSMADLYALDPAVRYVAAFQNWLKPSGASIDHLHKQVVAIDEHSVQTDNEVARLRNHPNTYDDILSVAVTRRLVIAQNDHAVALAGFGHRYPTLAIWPLGTPANPWEVSEEQMRGVSDLLHAMHAATGSNVPTNEEWYHRPPDVITPVRWRILLKWRISTIAGFEGGTQIYLNTLDPWSVYQQVVPRLLDMRDEGLIAPFKIGDECQNVSPALLRD